MLIVISPAKKLDMQPESSALTRTTQPAFRGKTEELLSQLKTFTSKDFKTLMGVSDAIANLNRERYQQWQASYTKDNAKAALLAFKGDVYQGMSPDTFDAGDMDYAQGHLRILSGLYGYLRPKDLMQPYRLEMGTALKNSAGNNLYDFWKTEVTQALNKSIRKNQEKYLVNLASNEYFKVLDTKTLDVEVITPVFKDYKNGQYKVISFLAKKARGMMCAYLIKNRVEDIEAIKKFSEAGYHFDKPSSNNKELVFLRKREQ